MPQQINVMDLDEGDQFEGHEGSGPRILTPEPSSTDVPATSYPSLTGSYNVGEIAANSGGAALPGAGVVVLDGVDHAVSNGRYIAVVNYPRVNGASTHLNASGVVETLYENPKLTGI